MKTAQVSWLSLSMSSIGRRRSKHLFLITKVNSLLVFAHTSNIVLDRREFSPNRSTDIFSTVRVIQSWHRKRLSNFVTRSLGPIFAEGNIASIHRDFERMHLCNHFCNWFKVPTNYNSQDFGTVPDNEDLNTDDSVIDNWSSSSHTSPVKLHDSLTHSPSWNHTLNYNA